MRLRVIIVNPQAKRLRKNLRIRRKIQKLFAWWANIIDLDGITNMLSELDRLLGEGCRISEIYVVGGDGTFNHILNWTLAQPQDLQPTLMSMGGGEFCYMTKLHGLSSKNPIRNLKLIVSGKVCPTRVEWEPIKVHDSLTDKHKFGALVANGIVSDFLEWYDEVGKGNMLKVVWMIIVAVASVMIDAIRKWHGKLKRVRGQVKMDSFTVPTPVFVGFAAGAVRELLPFCRPFKGKTHKRNFNAIAYWGSFRQLAFAAPFAWFGKIAFWLRHRIKNQPTHALTVQTSDLRMVFDGDLFYWSTNGSGQPEERTFTVTKGPTVNLLSLTTTSP